MQRVLAAVVATLLASIGYAEDHDHHTAKPTSPSDAPIQITINPEGRVSAVLAGAMPPLTCGTAAKFPLKVVNNGFVTAQLEAQLVGEAPPGVMLDFQPNLLTGAPVEMRMLNITLTKTGETDLTIAFKAHSQISDFGGRNRVHFLIHCLP